MQANPRPNENVSLQKKELALEMCIVSSGFATECFVKFFNCLFFFLIGEHKPLTVMLSSESTGKENLFFSSSLIVLTLN